MVQPKYMGGLGFRDIEIFNLALLARQAWRLLINPNSLCAQILKAVYFPSGDLLRAQVGNNPSKTWRAICDGIEVLKQGLIKRIGDGESTHIWNYNWIPRTGMFTPIASKVANPPSRVCELIDHTSMSWKSEEVRKYFLEIDSEAILRIPLSMRNQEDYWAWHHERNGLFTVRSAYRMLIEAKKRREDYFEGRGSCSDAGRNYKEWKQLWKLKLPSKIKVFCWRLALDSIPTASVLKRKNLAATPECKICGAEDDTWDHSLLRCTMSRCVWALLDEDLSELLASLRIVDPKQWLFFMCSNVPQAESTHILVTCWAIWNARRKFIHEGIMQSPFSIMTMAKRLIEELEFVNRAQFKETSKCQPRLGSQCWRAPESGFSKLKTDAAVSKSGSHGAVAAVCRDNQGAFIACSALVVQNVSDPETLEAMACLEAQALAEDCRINKVLVASDCLNVINNINVMPRCVYMMVLQDIHQRSKSFDCVRFAHEGKESNREAHFLAKYACTLGVGRHIWLTSPPIFIDVNTQN